MATRHVSRGHSTTDWSIPSESLVVGAEDRRQPNYRRHESITGYTGFYPKKAEAVESHALDESKEKYMIRGYTGFRPMRRSVIGEPTIPDSDKQPMIRQSISPGHMINIGEEMRTSPQPMDSQQNTFRAFAKHMDTMERYHTAVQHLAERGQNQEMLLGVVQAKFSERVNSYAAQLTRTRKLFEAFDVNKDGVLDEGEFRECLEKLNIQFDDVQSLALFAYFDRKNTNYIEWEDFADHAMVFNPKGGTAVLPKMITAVAKSHQDILQTTSSKKELENPFFKPMRKSSKEYK